MTPHELELHDLCVHCRKMLKEHADGKCLYGPTQFKQIRCHRCNVPIQGRGYRVVDDALGTGTHFYHDPCYHAKAMGR